MKASVIIPCHNAGRWVAAALRSVAAQTYPVHEVIVIDDASTDNSLLEIEGSGVPTKVLTVAFRNAAAARNAGIEVATGDWLALLDADDIWYPNHMARAVELLGKSEDIAFMSNHDWIGLHSELLEMPVGNRTKLAEPRLGMGVEDFFAITRQGFHFGHSTVLYRRDRVRAVGMFDAIQKRRHDLDLWLRMISVGTWTYDTVKAVGYRENTPGSISKDALECDYFELRTLVRNAEHCDGPMYRQNLARQARRAMGIAFVDGPADHYARIRELAWPHLAAHYKLAYAVSLQCPELARRLIKAKRRVVAASKRANRAE